MTRKITLAILTTLVAALLLVGVGTIGLANARARATTEHQLRGQVNDVAARLGDVLEAPPAPDEVGIGRDELLRRRLRTTRLITRVLNLDDFGVVTIGAQGRIIGELPATVDPATFDIATIEPGQVRSVRSAGQVVVARAVGLDRMRLVVIAARRPNPGLGPSVRWFLIAAALTIALGALVARTLGRRLARPVVDASAVTQRLAAGDLSARLPAPGPRGRRRAERVDELDQHDGRQPAAIANRRAAVSLVGLARSADPAHLDSRLRRGNRRFHGRSPSAPRP